MKTETAKKAKIREAYGEYWEFSKDRIDENGYDINHHKNCQIVLKKSLSVDFMIYKDKIRPKSLSGIENNNGWIKIESEADLPNEYINAYFILKSNNAILSGKYDGACFEYALRYYDYQEVTHYQPILKPEPPIY